MPALNFAWPRPLLPFALDPSSSSDNRVGKRAIQLKLSDEALLQLRLLAQQGVQPTKGAIRVDLSGTNPAFIINGNSYPLLLSPEPPHSELLRLAPAAEKQTIAGGPRRARDELEPIATISHKAVVKPGGNLERAGHSLRENRELAEKEREGRRAVLLDNTSGSRSNSLSRAHPPSTSSAPTSRNASPATRAPSRLTAVPVKPPTPRIPPPIKPPTSSFRIGKGTVPASLSRQSSRSSSREPKELESGKDSAPSSASASPAVPTGLVSGAASPPDTAVSPQAVSPSRQSSSSSESSHSSSSSQLKSSSTGRTSLSSAGSPDALQLELKVSAPAASPAITVTTKAGGGGVMKGKETLKKEKRKEERVKDKPVAAPAPAPAPKSSPYKSKATISSSDEEDDVKTASVPITARTIVTSMNPVTGSSTSSADIPLAARPSAPAPPLTHALPKRPASVDPSHSESDKKKRKLLNGVEASTSTTTSTRNASPSPARSRAQTPISSPRIVPTVVRTKHTTVVKPRRHKEERWYSSSDEDEDDVKRTSSAMSSSASTGSNNNGNKRRRTISSNSEPMTSTDDRGRPTLRVPSHLQPSSAHGNSPLRSSSLPPPPETNTTDAVQITSRTQYDDFRTQFTKGYEPYLSLYNRLIDERTKLSASRDGKGGTTTKGMLTLSEVTKLVNRVNTLRSDLSKIKEGMRIWVEQEQEQERSRRSKGTTRRRD